MPIGAIVETFPWFCSTYAVLRHLTGSSGRASSSVAAIFITASCHCARSLCVSLERSRALSHALASPSIFRRDRTQPPNGRKIKVLPPSSSCWFASASGTFLPSVLPPPPPPPPISLALHSSTVSCLSSLIINQTPSGSGGGLFHGHRSHRSHRSHGAFHRLHRSCRSVIVAALSHQWVPRPICTPSPVFRLSAVPSPSSFSTPWRAVSNGIKREWAPRSPSSFAGRECFVLSRRSSFFLHPPSSSCGALRAISEEYPKPLAGPEAAAAGEDVAGGGELSTENMRDIVEYAKSARAACKAPGCGGKIEKGTLRVGRITKGDGGFDVTRWYHPKCYFKTASDGESGASCVEAIVGFNLLKVSDQEMLRRLEREGKGVEDGSRSPKRRKLEDHYPLWSKASSPGVVVDEPLSHKKAASAETKEIDRAGWEAILAGFSEMQLSSVYKGAILPKGWKAFQSVIIGEVNDIKPSHKIASFDFDGCLVNTSVRRHGADSWSLLYPSVPEKLQKLHEDGFKLVIFTNESNIDRWVNSRQKAIDSKIGRIKGLVEKVKMPIQVFIACAKSGTGDPCRKPGIGMWELMERYFNDGMEIDKSQSFFVGDAAGRRDDFSSADRDFAKEVGIKFLLPENMFQSDGQVDKVL